MEEQKTRIPFAGIIVGDTLYWVCIIGALIATIGPIIILLAPNNNIADPFRIFSLVWQGKSSQEIWAAVTTAGKYPGPHFWIHNFGKGDGITQLGVWLACSCSLPAAFFGGIVYLLGLGGARKSITFFIICCFVALMILYAMLI